MPSYRFSCRRLVWDRFLWISKAYLLGLLFFGQVAPAQTTCQFRFEDRPEARAHLLRLALRAGASEPLQKKLQALIREKSIDGDLLQVFVDQLAREEQHLQARRSASLRVDRLASLRLALERRYCFGRHRADRHLADRHRADGSGPAQAHLGQVGSIEGRVTDADSGIPLDFEFVDVFDALGQLVDFDLTIDGNYALEDLAPGTYFVLADASDHFDELYDNIPCPLEACDVTSGTPVQVVAGESTTGIDFALDNGGRILGRLTDSNTGLPLSLEFVDVFNALGDRIDLTLTDGAGNYLVGGLPTGTYFVRADPDDHLDELFDNLPCPLMACNVTEGTQVAVTLGSDTTGIDFALDVGGQISGHLSEQVTGLSLDFEFVDVFNPLGEFVRVAFTDSAGNYRIGGLPTGTYFVRTDTLGDFFDELYDDLPCPDEACDPTSGTPVEVEPLNPATGIDFVLSVNGPAVAPRLSENSGMIVPFLVDLTDTNGRTTFFAIHNTTSQTQTVQLSYHGTHLEETPVRVDQVTLGPNATTPINVRNDLTGFDTSGVDLLQGLILITQQGMTTAPDLIGDSFSLDPANDFASGDKLLRASDFCNRQKIRFVDFGSGTEFKVLLNEPRREGTPSFSYTAYSEAGSLIGSGDFFTEDHLLRIDRSQLASQAFGVLEVDFGNSLGGSISATFSAFGRFSVELTGECLR